MKLKRIVLLSLVLAMAGTVLYAQRTTTGSGRSGTSRYTLTINSNVRNSEVFLNAVRQKGVTPMEIILTAGSYSVTVRAEGYRDYVTNVNLTRNMVISANLQPITYSLTVTSSVQNSSVYIDGQGRGRAPTRIELPQGRYTVLVEAQNHEPYTQVVNLSRDIAVNAQLKMITFTLNVTSNVQGANVFLDGRRIGSAPLKVEVTPGRYTLSLSAAGFTDFSQIIVVEDRYNINVNMRKATAEVAFSVPSAYLNPADKDPLRLFKLFIDGNQVRSSLSATFEVEAGEHLIRVETGGLVFEARYVFEAGEDYMLEFNPALLLKPAPARGF
jgi:hypothetical protein